MNNWVYRLADGMFLYGGFYEPTFDPLTQGVVTLPDERMPDRELEMFDAGSPTKRRARTADERAAAQAAMLNAKLEEALATGDVIIRAAFTHLPTVVGAIQAGRWDEAAQERSVQNVKTTAKTLLLQRLTAEV